MAERSQVVPMNSNREIIDTNSTQDRIDMGLGKIGNSDIIFKRKFRWTFRVEELCQADENGNWTRNTMVPESFVKIAARPKLTLDETEISFLNGKMYIPGKGTWDNITVTYYDVATSDNQPLWNWIASVYDYPDPVRLYQGSAIRDYAGLGVLYLYDGCGQLLEGWNLFNLWPQSVNFGDLDMTSSEELRIEMTLRYSAVKYKSYCPNFVPQACCTPCKQ